MKSILTKIGKLLSYPYRAGIEFVDTRPHINTVRGSLSQLAPVVVMEGDGKARVALQLGDSDISIGDLHVSDLGDREANCVFARGVAAGFIATRQRVEDIRVSNIRSQNKLLREYQRNCQESKEVLARSEDLGPENLGGALPQGA